MSCEKLLTRVLYEILKHGVSFDVAFSRVCGKTCASGVEREELYELARSFVVDYVKLVCIAGKPLKLRKLAKLWRSNPAVESSEPHCRLSVPKWLYDKLSLLLGEGEAYKLLESTRTRIWWLRVNTLKASVESVARSLEAEGVEFTISDKYPYMVKVTRSPKPVRLLSVVKEFKAIPQDIASAVVVEALNPEPGDTILDACAAPGIKASLIAMLTEGKARITALDISTRRLLKMKSLMKKLGVPEGTVEYRVADARDVQLSREYSKALVDAPCSNTGALAKDPSLRVTLKPEKVEYYSALQKDILVNIARQVSTVVYSTCSLMPEEGEEVVMYTAGKLSLKLEKPQVKICNPGYRAYSIAGQVCRLYPHIDESEGFFISKLTS